MKQLRKRLTYANVMSTVAVFLVLGGATAIAADQLGKNSVGSKQLKKNAVTAAKLKNNAVTTPKIKDGAVSGGKLADGSVTTQKIAGGAVTTDRIAEGAITGGKIANGSVSGDKLATQYLPASTVGVPLAGANVSATGFIRTWFNRYGGKPTVEKVATGAYKIIFPGLEGQAYYDNSIVLASLNEGETGEISRTSSDGDPRIATYNSAGDPTDKSFDLVLFLPGGE